MLCLDGQTQAAGLFSRKEPDWTMCSDLLSTLCTSQFVISRSST